MNTMIKQDFILLIMNCKKYADKASLQKTAWLRNIQSHLKYYHVIGDEELATPFVFDEENNVLRLKVADDYNSLPKKVITAYQAIYDTYKFTYIFKTDDDQMLVNLRFFDVVINIISNKSPTIHYGGNIVDVPQAYLSQYHRIHPELPSYLPVLKTKYCSGRFYFLSREAVVNLISKREYICREFLEDYAIGYNLSENYKGNMLQICTDNSFKDM
jgi:hypothetical protein